MPAGLQRLTEYVVAITYHIPPATIGMRFDMSNDCVDLQAPGLLSAARIKPDHPVRRGEPYSLN
jgi:hypothetical protein